MIILALEEYLSLSEASTPSIGGRSLMHPIRELVTPDIADTTTIFFAPSRPIMEAVLSIASTLPRLVPQNFMTFPFCGISISLEMCLWLS